MKLKVPSASEVTADFPTSTTVMPDALPATWPLTVTVVTVTSTVTVLSTPPADPVRVT